MLTFDNTLKLIISTMLAIIGFFMVQTYNKLLSIEKDLSSVKIELTKIQAEQLTVERVHDIAKFEIYQYHKILPKEFK